MKFAVIIALGLLIGGLSYMQLQNSDLHQQLELTMSFQSQLQQQSEESTRQRLEFEQQISDLQDQLLNANSRLSGLEVALREAEDKADPQYAELLEQARREVARKTETAKPRRSAGASPFAVFSDPNIADARAAEIMPKLYSSFVNALGIAGTERLDVMEALVEFGSERYQMLGALMDGSLTPEQAVALFGAQGLANGMQDSLTEAQLAELSQYELLVKQDTLREVYERSLGSYGDQISGLTQDQVMEVVLDELFSEQNNYGAIVAEDGSMLSAYNDKIAAFDRARDRLQGELSEDQRGQLDRFIETQSRGVDVVLESTTDGSGQISTTQMRIGAQDLPLAEQ